jgi:hypothetical protein
MVLVFERRPDDEKRSSQSHRTVLLPDGIEAGLAPNEWDAYHLFSDLCSVTSESLFHQKKVKPERQEILRLSSIVPTFGLELIESILSGFAEGFRKVGISHHGKRDVMLIKINLFTAAKRIDRPATTETVPYADERSRGAPVFSNHAEDRAGHLSSPALLLPADSD